MSKDNNKKKKEKITYIDDGRTVADMSAFDKGRRASSDADKRSGKSPRLLPGSHSSMKEQAQTYFAAVRMMFLPMLVVIGILTLAFLVLWFLL